MTVIVKNTQYFEWIVPKHLEAAVYADPDHAVDVYLDPSDLESTTSNIYYNFVSIKETTDE